MFKFLVVLGALGAVVWLFLRGLEWLVQKAIQHDNDRVLEALHNQLLYHPSDTAQSLADIIDEGTYNEHGAELGNIDWEDILTQK